ncbi:MAG: hypothetical protein K0S27_974 [Gammaproteobacteria bacterium]|jgi:membrane-bound serine protease (ClpP class)|nr:hypothetical protein [Gammaproteobacteria bacterium]
MRKYRGIYLLFAIVSLALSISSYATTHPVILIEINGTINPSMQDYVTRGIQDAAKQKAELILLQLNTEGGLETSIRGITKAIFHSPIPVVSYVSPEGARAANNGIFVLYASHIAAMAPGTNLGAPTKANIGSIPLPTGNPEQKKQIIKTVATNNSAAYIRLLAKLRHRNAEWGELAIREAISLSASEALKKKVINLIAANNNELLKKLNGILVQGVDTTHYLKTKNAIIKTVKPNWRYPLLSIITTPNIAYILFLIGIYGLFFEFIKSGYIIPGIVGIISLLIALYAFQLLPINYLGVTLLLGGIAFLVAEAFVSSFGILGISGMIAFIAGSILFLQTALPEYQITWTIILTMSLITLGFTLALKKSALGKRKNYRE